MQDAMRRVPRSLDLIGQGSPRLRHAKQHSPAPGVLKLGSDLDAVGGAPPVEPYEFAGRHPHPQYGLSDKIPRQRFVPHRNERICREVPLSPARTHLRGGEMAGQRFDTELGRSPDKHRCAAR